MRVLTPPCEKEAFLIQLILQLVNLPEMPLIQVLTVSRAKAKLKPTQTSQENNSVVFFGETKSDKQGCWGHLIGKVLNEKR